MAAPEEVSLVERWRLTKEKDEKDLLFKQILERGLFPKEMPHDFQTMWETTGGLYPDYDDPLFLVKLIRKREFQESKQPSVKESLEKGEDRCRTTEDFELSSVQRFVSRFLSPRTP